MGYKKTVLLLLIAGAAALELYRQGAKHSEKEEEGRADTAKTWKPDPGKIFTFRHDADGLILTGCVPYPGGDTLTVPEEIGGRKIVELGFGAFTGMPETKNIILPDSIKRADPGAFTACRALERVHFGEGLQKLSSSAFYLCPLLKEIDLPASLSDIGDTAVPQGFDGVIRTSGGSAAERYAKENGFRTEQAGTAQDTNKEEVR